MLSVTKEFVFDSAHILKNSDLNDKENKKVFGKCNNIHGHTYKLLVTVTGDVGFKDGMIINFNNLKSIVKPLIEKLDHKNLNEVIPVEITTAENMIMWIRDELKKELNVCKLRLYETPTSYVEWVE